MVLYGQIIIGAPGAGKTTYCDGMQQYLRLLGRECYVVNLDPANEVPLTADDKSTDDAVTDEQTEENNNDGTASNLQLPYEIILDVCQDIISLDAVMNELHLGPNGGLLYCMEYIEHHFGEVLKLLKERLGIDARNDIQRCRAYLLFDLPGQIELTAHSNVITKIAERLVRELDLRLVCVQLVDAAVCLTDVSKFIGASLVCTASMMRLELPCVNVLSKMDLLQDSNLGGGNGGVDNNKSNDDDDDDSDFGYDDYGTSPMPFNLEFFTQCHDLHRLVDYLDSNPMEFMGEQSNEEYMDDSEYIRAQQKTRTSNFSKKYQKLHHELCEVVEDFGLLSFLPLAIQDPIQPTEGYTLTTEKAGLLRGVPVPPPYYADHGKRGRGLFAKRDIKKGELVHDGTDSDVVFPDALSWRQLVFSLQREMACSLVDWSWTQSTSENGELELFSAPNISVLLNGSSGKTVNINPKTGYSSKFYALRDIKKGEELVTDYDVYETNWKAVGL